MKFQTKKMMGIVLAGMMSFSMAVVLQPSAAAAHHRVQQECWADSTSDEYGYCLNAGERTHRQNVRAYHNHHRG